jgi:aryl-alcohol dehydrogenase-like predicted oxidoreductase
MSQKYAVGSDKLNIKTLQGLPASILGLAGNPQIDISCPAAAYAAGINYFFFYSLSAESFLDGLKSLLAGARRETLIITTGSQDRDVKRLRDYLERVRHRLATDMVDVFFAEYVSPADDMGEVQAVLEELHTWKEEGLIRYVGATVHDRTLALELIEGDRCEVLMHRYNMAHRGAEAKVLPAAHRAALPVVAFTCTRWGSLLKGHPNWRGRVPTAADCYRYVLHHPAVHLALTAPTTRVQLEENLQVLQAAALSVEEEKYWQEYGNIVYGDGQDTFETEWP